jgi:hypothetical protein
MSHYDDEYYARLKSQHYLSLSLYFILCNMPYNYAARHYVVLLATLLN